MCSRKCNFKTFATSVLEGVGGQYLAPAVLPLEKTRYQIWRRLGVHGDRFEQSFP